MTAEIELLSAVDDGVYPNRDALQASVKQWHENPQNRKGVEGVLEAPRLPLNMEYPDGRAWRLGAPLHWTIGSSGVTLVVPANFVHDSTSVPRLFWSLLPPNGKYSRAAIIHDYLYWAQTCTRTQADNLLMIAMKESDVGWIHRQAVYAAVDLLGEGPWEENKRQKAKGLPRFDPTPIEHADAKLSWPQVRQRLFASGYRDPAIADPGDYAHLGNGRDVP